MTHFSVTTDISSIKQMTAELNNTVMAMQERLGEAETHIAHLKETSERIRGAEITRQRPCGTECKPLEMQVTKCEFGGTKGDFWY